MFTRQCTLLIVAIVKAPQNHTDELERDRGGEEAQSCKPDCRSTVSPLLSASVLRVNLLVIPHEPACNSVTSG